MKRSTWDCATHDTELSPPRLDALSAAVARRLKSHYGGEQPNSTSVRVYDGYVVTVLEQRAFVSRSSSSPALPSPEGSN